VVPAELFVPQGAGVLVWDAEDYLERRDTGDEV
jgi:hypothetical protein